MPVSYTHLDVYKRQIQGLCDALGVPYIIRKTYLGPLIFEERKEENPCSLCARMRRGILPVSYTHLIPEYFVFEYLISLYLIPRAFPYPVYPDTGFPYLVQPYPAGAYPGFSAVAARR